MGQLLQIRTNQRVPADVVLLRTSEGATSGEVYLRTEQLDGGLGLGQGAYLLRPLWCVL